MTSLAARQIINEVAETYGVSPEMIVSERRSLNLVAARKDIAEMLDARGYTSPQIGRALNRDHTTVIYYLGRAKRKARPALIGPITKAVARGRGWRPPPKKETPPPASRRNLYLVPYAGADLTDYKWKERRAPWTRSAATTASTQTGSAATSTSV